VAEFTGKICARCAEFEYDNTGLCRRHYAFKVWTTNTDVDHLGIISFFKAVIPKAFKDFKYGVPYFHREILWEVLRDNKSWTFADRQIAIAAPRGSSKTTLLSKGLVLYCALFGIKKYIVISSKTARAAQKNMRWLRQVLGSQIIVELFGDLRPDSRGKRLEVDEIEGIWTKELIVLQNGVTIEAVGMGQQLRSSAEGEDVNRIDLFLADDTETDENTGTPDRREDNEVWLFETVLPSLDVDTGTIVFINTMTHTESILAKLLKSNSGWRKKFYEIDWAGGSQLLWKEKFSPKTIESIRNNYALVGRLRSFYKEYHNRVQSDTSFHPEWIKYYTGKVFFEHGENWLEYTPTDSLGNRIGKTETRPCYLTLGIDLAFSQSRKADYTVLLPLAQIPDGRKFILPFKRGRFTLYENELISTQGIVSEAKKLMTLYKFTSITIDATGTQKGTFSAIKKDLANGDVRIIPYFAPGGREAKSKLMILEDTLFPQYEIGNIYHQPEGMDELYIELIAFGDTHDDILDALYDSMKNSKTPSSADYNPMFGRDNDEDPMVSFKVNNTVRMVM
jgi:hypothetical protein